jgi:hypothetical protein
MATSVTNLPSRNGGGWGNREGEGGEEIARLSGSYRGNEEGIVRQPNKIMEECVGSIPNPAREAEDGEGVCKPKLASERCGIAMHSFWLLGWRRCWSVPLPTNRQI